MTGVTARARMRADERKEAMINRLSAPILRRMATAAIGGISQRNVIGIGCGLIIFLMAGNACRGGSAKTGRVTLGTCGAAVSERERKARDMCKSRIGPCRDRTAMASLAAQRESCKLVIRRGGGFIILLMAATALQRQIHELTLSAGRMTTGAAHVLMPAHERKA